MLFTYMIYELSEAFFVAEVDMKKRIRMYKADSL